MSLITFSGPNPGAASFNPSSIAIPCDIGLEVLHFTNLANVITPPSGPRTMRNFAFRNAPASTIGGAPTIDGSKFTINTAGTDVLTTTILDTGGDYTIYCAMLNEDTGVGSQNQVMMAATTGGAHGISFAVQSPTQVGLKDFGLVGGTNTGVPLAQATVPNLAASANAWKLYAATGAFNSATGVITSTFMDLTDNVQPVVTTLPGASMRNVGTNALQMGANYQPTPAAGKGAFGLFVFCQTAPGGGGAHSPNQAVANGATFRNYLSLVGILGE